MPIYKYFCKKCDKEWENSHTVSDRYQEICCDEVPDIIITGLSKNNIQCYNYYDHGLGEWIKSPKHRKQLMKEKNLVEIGTQKLF